jgi:type I restriction enzyme M protein
MGEKLPKWLEDRYSALWDTFGNSRFGLEDAVKVLTSRINTKITREEVPAHLSELRRAGWLVTESDLQDSRQKWYRLKSRLDSVKKAINEKTELTRSDVEGILKKAADLIRTRVDYKFILILLFLKRVSDKWEAEFEKACKEAVADGLSEDEAKQEAKNPAYHDFDLPVDLLWDNIRKDVSRLPEKFSAALKAISELNPELKDVVESVDFVQFASSRENAEILRQLFEVFSEQKLRNVSPDILGDAYEWWLRYFAPTKAKEGEIITPREVIRLLVKILDPKPGKSVYDPACGSGGMLILSYKHVEDQYGKKEASRLFLFGQEANRSILALCKMNMYIHGIADYHLEFGDTFLYPKFKEGEGIKQFDLVMANPPWNQDGYDEEVLKKGEYWKQRFSFGFVPRQNADWAWIQHMLASAKDDSGKVGIVIDNGSLFRGGKEKAIRSALLARDWIESVILLPEKLFYNTPATGTIIVLNKNKSPERRGSVLFINASGEAEQHPEVRKLNRLGDGNIKRIADAYENFSGQEGFSRIVSIKEEIEKNDNNLNVTLYVMAEKEREQIDIAKEYKELKELEKERQQTANKLEQYISELTQALGGSK